MENPSTPVLSLACHLCVLLSIMLLAGLLGGVIEFCREDTSDENEQQFPLLKRLLLGVAAALVVPLFLNMISSSLVADARADHSKYLVFAGFCIIAAISSQSFLESITKKTLTELEKVKNKQESMSRTMEPIAAKETEPSSSPEELAATSPNLDLKSLDKEDKKVLAALANTNWARRSFSGILKSSGIQDLQAAYSLDKLRRIGIVDRSDKGGVQYWWLTDLGRAAAPPTLGKSFKPGTISDDPEDSDRGDATQGSSS